jgi:hypothetical protein
MRLGRLVQQRADAVGVHGSTILDAPRSLGR